MRKINEIATEIKKDWTNVNYAAKPYLQAMLGLENKEDKYFLDTGKSIVLYFLSNASGYRGHKARELKKELKQLIK
jgi:hypothetical protein